METIHGYSDYYVAPRSKSLSNLELVCNESSENFWESTIPPRTTSSWRMCFQNLRQLWVNLSKGTFQALKTSRTYLKEKFSPTTSLGIKEIKTAQANSSSDNVLTSCDSSYHTKIDNSEEAILMNFTVECKYQNIILYSPGNNDNVLHDTSETITDNKGTPKRERNVNKNPGLGSTGLTDEQRNGESTEQCCDCPCNSGQVEMSSFISDSHTDENLNHKVNVITGHIIESSSYLNESSSLSENDDSRSDNIRNINKVKNVTSDSCKEIDPQCQDPIEYEETEKFHKYAPQDPYDKQSDVEQSTTLWPSVRNGKCETINEAPCPHCISDTNDLKPKIKNDNNSNNCSKVDSSQTELPAAIKPDENASKIDIETHSQSSETKKTDTNHASKQPCDCESSEYIWMCKNKSCPVRLAKTSVEPLALKVPACSNITFRIYYITYANINECTNSTQNIAGIEETIATIENDKKKGQENDKKKGPENDTNGTEKGKRISFTDIENKPSLTTTEEKDKISATCSNKYCPFADQKVHTQNSEKENKSKFHPTTTYCGCEGIKCKLLRKLSSPNLSTRSRKLHDAVKSKKISKKCTAKCCTNKRKRKNLRVKSKTNVRDTSVNRKKMRTNDQFLQTCTNVTPLCTQITTASCKKCKRSCTNKTCLRKCQKWIPRGQCILQACLEKRVICINEACLPKCMKLSTDSKKINKSSGSIKRKKEHAKRKKPILTQPERRNETEFSGKSVCRKGCPICCSKNSEEPSGVHKFVNSLIDSKESIATKLSECTGRIIPMCAAFFARLSQNTGGTKSTIENIKHTNR